MNHDLQYNEKYNLLVCKLCDTALNSGFDSHCRKVHNDKVSNSDVKHITGNYIDETNVYFLKDQPLLPRLDFRPVTNGFKCNDCEFYGGAKNTMKKHVKKFHDGTCDGYTSCLVQTLGNSSNIRYFGVFDTGSAPTVRRNVGDSDAVKVMRELLDYELPQEPLAQRSLFYRFCGWISEEDQPDLFSSVEKASYVAQPREVTGEDPSQDLDDFKTAFSLFKLIIHDINNAEIGVRFNVTNGGKALSKPQSKGTIIEYSAVWGRMLLFLIRLVRNPIEGIELSEEIGDLVNQYLAAPSRELLVNLSMSILKEDPHVSEPENLISLFVRFSCYLSDGSMMPVENVERLIAKVLDHFFAFFNIFSSSIMQE